MIQRERGLILYEKDREDRIQEAVTALARKKALDLDDEAAAQVGALFPLWEPGTAYAAGTRISDEEGRLFKVVQDHTAQADWPVGGTPALYTPLGVTAAEPEAVPEWRQPAGAHDAYQTGDRVRWNGKIYRSTVDGNIWAPDVLGWTEEEP